MFEFRLPTERLLVRTDLSVRAVHCGEMRVDVHVREQLLANGLTRMRHAQAGGQRKDGGI
jgi:hypothetical protein